MAIVTRFTGRLHRDERGSMTIVSVFAVMFLAMLLGMVMNVGRHVDGKIRMQNAADSAAYSGAVVLARGMNTLAFTNQLLCDVFAVDAFLHEARDQNSASYAPRILGAWNNVARQLSSSGFPKFTAVGSAIQQKTPLEQQMVSRYSAWAKSVSDQVLPLMDEILSDELIPKYQRAVVVAFPDIAATAAAQTALQNGTPDHGRGPMFGAIWRADGRPVGGGNEAGYSPDERTLPVVDPEMDQLSNQSDYVEQAQSQRYTLSHKFLNDWNAELLSAFDQEAKLSQFANLWRSFTCGYLDYLLNQVYPQTNLPMLINEEPENGSATQESMSRFTFVGVVYWKKLPEMAPGLFKNPLQPDAQAYAEVHLFIPLPRLEWVNENSTSNSSQSPLGGVPGQIAYLGSDGSQGGGSSSGNTGGSAKWTVGRVGGPMVWNLLNQSWDCQLTPAATSAIPTILESDPRLPGFDAQNFKLPSLADLTSEDLDLISPH